MSEPAQKSGDRLMSPLARWIVGGLTVVSLGTSAPELFVSLLSTFQGDDGIAVSMFIAPDPRQVRASAKVGAQFIELHTGCYANALTKRAAAAELKRLAAAAELAHSLGLRVNAGHGLNYQNTRGIFAVPHLETLNTGHSIVSRAVFVGLRQAVREMLVVMKGYRG